MSQVLHLNSRIPAALRGYRLDQALSTLFPDYSRSRLQAWIRAGEVRLDDRAARPKDKVKGGETVAIAASLASEIPWQPEALPVTLVYSDAALLVLNKPAGIVVHPAAGNRAGTLVNALLHHAPELADLPRAGLVHRLDKDTTGLLVVARTLASHKYLVEQLKARALLREYLALVSGRLVSGGTVDASLGRHPVDRKRIAVVARGRAAVTHYRVVRRYQAHTLIRLRLETGRTHQIRVHLAHLRHPVVGDPLYGGRPRLPPGCVAELAAALRDFGRQALHAERLGLIHPTSGEFMQWHAPLPSDMARLVALLDETSQDRVTISPDP